MQSCHLAETSLVETHRDGWFRGQFGGDFQRFFEDLFLRNDVMNQADTCILPHPSGGP